MKRHLPVGILMLAVVYFAVTGFQCGSAEMTTAKLAIKNEQYDKAEESLIRAVEKNPQEEEAWFLLGQVRLELRKYSEMNEAYSKALSISNAHEAEIQTNRRVIWNRLYEGAIADYQKGESQPESYEEAIAKLETALEMNPDSVQTYFALGLVNFQKGEDDAAIPYLQTALEKDPTYEQALSVLSDIHLNKAVQLDSDGKPEAAVAEYMIAADILQRTFDLNPDEPENINNLIIALERSNQDERLLQLTEEAVEQNPNNANFRYAYGVYLLKQEDYEASVNEFKNACELDPTNSNYTYNCGAAYLNWGVAIKNAADEEREKSDNRNVQPDTSYREKFREALPYLEKSTELDPQEASFWQSLAKAYTYLGMVDESEAAFNEFDRLTEGN